MKKLISKIRAKYKRGFTLLELLVVVLILAVLASISVPMYSRVMNRSRVSDGLNVLDSLASAQDKYFIMHGTYTDDFTKLNIPLKKHHLTSSKITTENFSYYKEEGDNCFYAVSEHGPKITLAKNYKTKARTVCSGRDCSKISGIIRTVNDLEQFCTEETTCNVSPEDCLEGEIYNAGACACIPEQIPECTNGQETPWQDSLASCKAVQCGHIYSKEVCKNGQWAKKEDCQNTWLYKQCEDKEVDLLNCNCVGEVPATCEDEETIFGSYIDDGSCNTGNTCKIKHEKKVCKNNDWFGDYDCEDKTIFCSKQDLVLNEDTCECEEPSQVSCNAGDTQNHYYEDSDCNIELGKAVCTMWHAWEECVKGKSWIPEKECIDKATYCTQQGKVLNTGTCECEDEPSSCDPIDKPSCDGTVAGEWNPCSRGADPQGSGDPQAWAPCQYLCGYNVQRATCDEKTGKWSKSCDEIEHHTQNPNTPRTEICQGSGAEGSACGIKTLESVSCTLEVPYSALNFMINATYGECALPEEKNACWEGETEECTINGKQGIKTCTGCRWGNCVLPCDPGNQIQGSPEQRPCYTKNGVTNPELYCGTQTATGQVCDPATGSWSWDYTGATCENVQTKNTDYTECSPNNCQQRQQTFTCTYIPGGAPAGYYWSFSGWSACEQKPNTDAECLKRRQDLGNGIYCNDSCKRITCTDGSFNSAVGKCTKSQTLNNYKGFFYSGNINDVTNPSYYHCCGTENYTYNQNCTQPTCNYGNVVSILAVTNKTPDEYCKNGSLDRVIAQQLTSHPGSCHYGTQNYSYGQIESLQGRFFKCVEGTSSPYNN